MAPALDGWCKYWKYSFNARMKNGANASQKRNEREKCDIFYVIVGLFISLRFFSLRGPPFTGRVHVYHHRIRAFAVVINIFNELWIQFISFAIRIKITLNACDKWNRMRQRKINMHVEQLQQKWHNYENWAACGWFFFFPRSIYSNQNAHLIRICVSRVASERERTTANNVIVLWCHDQFALPTIKAYTSFSSAALIFAAPNWNSQLKLIYFILRSLEIRRLNSFWIWVKQLWHLIELTSNIAAMLPIPMNAKNAVQSPAYGNRIGNHHVVYWQRVKCCASHTREWLSAERI